MGKFYLRELSRSYCKSKAMAASATKRSLTRRLNHLRRLMDAGNSTVFSELCRIQEDLRAHELRAVQACQVRTRTQWVEEGEVSPSYFFSLESKRQRKKTMSGIADPSSGTIHHDPLEFLLYGAGITTTSSCSPRSLTTLLCRMNCYPSSGHH